LFSFLLELPAKDVTGIARELVKIEAKGRFFRKPRIASASRMEAVVAVFLVSAGMSQNELLQKFEGGSVSFDEYGVPIKLRYC
jgi:hypothetical protein